MTRPIGIRIHRGNELLEAQVFDRDLIKIGRLTSAHLRLEDPKVSRIHAVIEFTDGREVSIIDMGSAEGTRVNGEKVSRSRIKHGDEVVLGESRLVIVLDDAEIAAMRSGVTSAPTTTTATTTTAASSSTSTLVTGAFAAAPMVGASTVSGELNVSALRADLQLPAPPSLPTSSSSWSDLEPGAMATSAATSTSTSSPMSAWRQAPKAKKRSAPVAMPSILPPLPPIPEDAITPENRFVEVTLRWGSTVTDVKRFKNTAKVSIGTERTDDLFVPVVGGSLNLITSLPGQGWKVRFREGMSGHVARGDGSASLAESGAAADGDARALVLTDDTVITLGLGSHTVEVRAVPKSRIVPFAPFFDALWANAAVITLFLSAAVIATTIYFPVGMDSLDDDLLTNPTKFQTMILKPPPKDNAFLDKLKAPTESKSPKKNDAKSEKKKVEPKKEPKVAQPKPSNEEVVANKMAALFGGENGGVASIFSSSGKATALEAALGGIDGTKVAAGYGAGGLALRGGTGNGVGTGTLGGGAIGTRGRSSGDVNYGSSAGGLTAKKEREVTMTTGTPVVLGSLDPEIIRRIVREHGGQVRYCYESELTRTPGLYGKIVMKWLISGDGKVMSVTIAETQMKNANVENCLASRIKTWVFPKPKGGGIVIVNYPFVFKQSG
jgi:hypothetical protein